MMLTMTTRIKFLRTDGTGPYSGFDWPLPDGDTPGAWVEVAEELVPCRSGLHFTTLPHWREWANARLFVIEADGAVLDEGDKRLCRRARLTREITAWNETTLRLFAADCAERVLPIFERSYPHDTRPRAAIDMARRFARGAATHEKLAAAGAAAGAAAWDAAGAAARAAAWDADGAAAWAAARDAAGAAAGAAARESAGDAAWNPAWDAAWNPAWDAAGAWQDGILLDYLNGTKGGRNAELERPDTTHGSHVRGRC